MFIPVLVSLGLGIGLALVGFALGRAYERERVAAPFDPENPFRLF